MKEKSIKKNIGMNLLLTASNFLFPLITYSYVARILGPTGTGNVAFASSFLTYFYWVAQLGIPTYGLRECSRVRNDKQLLSRTVEEILIINGLATLISYIALFAVLIFVPPLHQNARLIAIMSISILLNSLGTEWLYQALEEYKYITIRSLIFKCIYVILVFFLVRAKEDYIIYGALTIFSSSASYICNFLNLRKKIEIQPVSLNQCKKHIKPIFTLFMASIIINVYANFDVVMIGFIQNDEKVGIYNAALKIRNIVLSVSTAVTAVIIPRMALYVKGKNKEKVYDLGFKSLSISFLLAIPLVAYIIIEAADVLLFIVGPKYAEAKTTLIILLICVVLLIFTNLLGNQLMISQGKENIFTKIIFIAAIINVVLNLLFIPQYGSAGAAVGTLAAESFNAIAMMICEKGEFASIWSRFEKGKFSIALILAIIGGEFCREFVVNLALFWRLVATTCIFFGIYYGILFILKEAILKVQLEKVLYRIRNGRRKRQ